MDYVKSLINLIGPEKSQEICKDLLNILMKEDGEMLLNLYLDLINEDLNFLESGEYYSDLIKIEKSKDNVLIYNLLKEKGPMTAKDIMKYPGIDLSSSLIKHRTHLSGRLNDLTRRGYLAKKRGEKSKQYFLTPEEVVKSAIDLLGLEYDELYTSSNLMKLADETNIPYRHLIRVIKDIKND
ncbi:hypothetical protein GQ472_03155 [archaeon]|nr:hypothetical protein [archaeon]